VADGVKTQKRAVSYTISYTNAVAVFGSSDHFATAAARRPESVGHELADGRWSRQLTCAQFFECFRDPRGWHGIASVRKVARSDDLPIDIYRLGGLWPRGQRWHGVRRRRDCYRGSITTDFDWRLRLDQ
jgi:hypothetical protein